MIRLVLVTIVVIPATIWYAVRMVWAVGRKRPNAACVCDEAPRKWASVLLWWSGVDVVLHNQGVIETCRLVG